MKIYFLFAVFLAFHIVYMLPSEYDDYDEDYEDEDYTNVTSTSNGTLSFTRELTNITRLSGKVVKLICEVRDTEANATGKRVSFTWLMNGVTLTRSKQVGIKTTREKDQRYRSVVRLSNLEYLPHRGWYECLAKNGQDHIKSKAFLDIVEEEGGSSNTLKFDDFEEDSDLSESITFLPNSPVNKLGKEFSTMPGLFEPNMLDSNSGSTKRTMPPHQFDLSSTGKMISILPGYNASEPLCQLYQGIKCKSYLENQFVFVQPPYSQADIEKKLEDAFLVISQSQDISSTCSKFAQPSLCYSAFPICMDSKKVNSYQKHNHQEIRTKLKDKSTFKDIRMKLTKSLRRICRKDCILLETELCSKEYAIAKRHPVLGQPLELEECEYLPEDESSKHCLSLGVDGHINKDDTCYWSDGRLYRGVKDVSISGKKCFRWAYQIHIPLSDYPELTGHNYCRNPGGVEGEPFCFVDQNTKEVCGIRKCANVVTIYVVVTFIVCLLVVIVAVIVCCRRKKHKAARNLQNVRIQMSTPMANKNIYGNPGPNSPMELNNLLPVNIPPPKNHHPTKGNYQNVTQFTHKELTFVEELGEGAFGKVYKGELKTKSGKIFVAVKSLKENASAKTQADFQREIELISELKHPNIICLVGVITKQEPVCMLFEFMAQGDLHEFLIANSPGEGKSLTQNQFLQMAIQIAQGMEYLADNHYVHRDLAARNCLVSSDLVVKISDFGLSRDMYSCDYYRVQSKSLLPVRWMPPESILYGKFTTESDVWSYGVVLWEIYSYGLQPYYGYNNQEVINMIRSRKLLPCPDACPSYCYSLMVECWAELAVRRPNFSEITYRLKVWSQNGNSNGAYFKTPENYPNAQRYGHSSKTSHPIDTQTLCPIVDATPEHSLTWERSLKSQPNKLHESQSSLTSRSSSLGNRTQSTSLSNEHKPSKKGGGSNDRRSHRRNDDSSDKSSVNVKNMIVNSKGDIFETKITL